MWGIVIYDDYNFPASFSLKKSSIPFPGIRVKPTPISHQEPGLERG